MDVLKGTTRTVCARGCRLRALGETTTTGRGCLSGGSLGRCTNQISPRCGDFFVIAGIVLLLRYLPLRKFSPLPLLVNLFIVERVIVFFDRRRDTGLFGLAFFFSD